MSAISKGNWYRLLFQRIDKAIADGFFLEATFIISGIIDDRLKSTITILDPTYSTRETIGEKCRRIRRFNDLDLRREFRYSPQNKFGLITEVSKWIREYRNPLTHTLGDPKDYILLRPGKTSPGQDFQTAATKGKDLARRLAAAVMRLKRSKN